MNLFVGFDNGVTGSIGVISQDGGFVDLTPVPVKKELSYTKKKQWITRIDHSQLIRDLSSLKARFPNAVITVLLERPMVNPTRFQSTQSAMRALESVLIALEELGLPYRYIDSREWQRALLPKGLEEKELKEAAVQIARRKFPSLQVLNGPKAKDLADGILIAEYGRQSMKTALAA